MAEQPNPFESITERYIQATDQGDPVLWTDVYSDDAVISLPNRPNVVGRKAILEFITEFFSNFDAHMEAVIDETEVFGEIAYGMGHATYKTKEKSEGQSGTSHMRFINILKRDGEGVWRIWRNLYNTYEPD